MKLRRMKLCFYPSDRSIIFKWKPAPLLCLDPIFWCNSAQQSPLLKRWKLVSVFFCVLSTTTTTTTKFNWKIAIMIALPTCDSEPDDVASRYLYATAKLHKQLCSQCRSKRKKKNRSYNPHFAKSFIIGNQFWIDKRASRLGWSFYSYAVTLQLRVTFSLCRVVRFRTLLLRILFIKFLEGGFSS